MMRGEDDHLESAGREPDASAGGAGAPPDPTGPNRAPDLTREYRGDGVTVQWYAGRCIHSANCVRALQHVFDPRRRPWVDPTAASAEEVIPAILRCPSGALHFVRHDGGAEERPDVPATVTPVRGGPFHLRGDVEIRGFDGQPIRRDTRVALCRCGHAHQLPLCDNSCRAIGWSE